jgi:hypothetical protein
MLYCRKSSVQLRRLQGLVLRRLRAEQKPCHLSCTVTQQQGPAKSILQENMPGYTIQNLCVEMKRSLAGRSTNEYELVKKRSKRREQTDIETRHGDESSSDQGYMRAKRTNWCTNLSTQSSSEGYTLQIDLSVRTDKKGALHDNR